MESKLDEVFYELAGKDALWPLLPVVMVEGSGKIVHCNAPAAEVFGYTPSELLGKEVEVLVPEELRDRHRQLRASTPARPFARATCLAGLKKDGTRFAVHIGVAQILTAKGAVIAVLVVDLTTAGVAVPAI